MNTLEGKTALIMGVANKRSIAWAIAQALSDAGARLAFTYQERVEEYVRELANSCPNSILISCDVQSDTEMDQAFNEIEQQFGALDILVHSVAFAQRNDLDGHFVDTSREGFQTALDISAYSLIAATKRAVPLMEKREGGSVLTMTYYGSEKVVPNYNVMGVAKAALESSVRYLAYDLGTKNIRVNAISAGPVRTLSARGISGFSQMEEIVAEHSPMKRNIDASDVGDLALFLCGSQSRSITGEVIYVDCGYNIMGM